MKKGEEEDKGENKKANIPGTKSKKKKKPCGHGVGTWKHVESNR